MVRPNSRRGGIWRWLFGTLGILLFGILAHGQGVWAMGSTCGWTASVESHCFYREGVSWHRRCLFFAVAQTAMIEGRSVARAFLLADTLTSYVANSSGLSLSFLQ